MSRPVSKGRCCTILSIISGGMAGETRLSPDTGGAAAVAMSVGVQRREGCLVTNASCSGMQRCARSMMVDCAGDICVARR